MADSSSYKPSSLEITPKEEPVTLDKLESPNPFLPADQVEFIFEEIAFTTNNEVALLYPSHSNSEYFKEYTAKTLDESKIWVSTPTWGIRGDIGINTFRNALRAQYLPHLSMLISLLLEYMMPEYENEELAINPTQLLNLSHKLRRFPKAKKPGAKSGLKRKQSSKHTSESKTKASKSKTGQSEKETQSSSAKDKRPSHPSPPTPVVGEMHKDPHQAAGGPTSLGATSKDGAYPQLSSGHDALVDSTVEANPGLSAHNDSIHSQQEDKPIIVSDESEEEEEVAKDKYTDASSHDSQKDELEQQKAKAEAEVASLKARPSYPDVNQLTNLLTKLKTLDSLLSLLNKVTETLTKFATVVENASRATTKDVPSAGHATALTTEGEKNTTKDAETNPQNELVDLLGIDVVEQYYKKKLLFGKYYDKMLKRRKSSKIINYDVITQKGPISLKVYREDETIEWREVVQACPDRNEKGWKTIYILIKTRMEYLDQTEEELKIDFNKPLKEQDPLNELNELANKKRKRSSDLKDHSRSTKKNKSSSLA
ncbi:hypothetical protein Tco_0144496 [Tanacetum coccineum]